MMDLFYTFWATWGATITWLAWTAGMSVLLLTILLVLVAYLILMDRKVWAAVQLRRGPNVVGPFGLLQSFADLLKFVLKEPIIPAGADKGVFLLAPLVTSILALAAWAVIPVGDGMAISNVNVGILYLFAISSLGVYGIIMGGWASNSKYPFLGQLAIRGPDGELRSFDRLRDHHGAAAGRFAQHGRHRQGAEGRHRHAARLDSLAPRLALVAAVPDVRHVLHLGAGRNQSPAVRFAGSEIELVAGFMVEYSSTPYLLFMLGEYVAIVTMCAMTTILFLGGWLPPIDVARSIGCRGRSGSWRKSASFSSCSRW